MEGLTDEEIALKAAESIRSKATSVDNEVKLKV